jgi:hypothetical protein
MTDPPQQLDDTAPLTVDSIVAVPASAVPVSSQAPSFFDIETQKLQIEKLKLVNIALNQDTEHRGTWARRLLPLCLGWLIAVVGVLIFQGFHIWSFHLDDSVLIAFIGTTTADVLGLGYIVVNYLFPKPQ